MLKFIILLFIAITPLSASGYQYYETNPYNTLSYDPTVCYISFEFTQSYEDVTKQAISNWQDSLQQYTNNPDIWNIYYKSIPIDHYDDVNDNVDSLGCDIFIDFVDIIYSNTDGSVLDVNGNMGTLTSGPAILDISTSKGLSYEQLISTVSHEMGHAFGLGHYITNEDELIEKWKKGIDFPSIMKQGLPSDGIPQITELDLKKMVTLYGNDGFEDLPAVIPKWIQTIFAYYGEGKMNDSELINAIQYMIETGIIQIN